MQSKSSMQDIADMLGISKNAVSLALNHKSGVSEELRSRVFEAANQLKYRTAQKNKKMTGNLLILMPEDIRNDKTFYYEVFWSIEKRAKERGYHAVISSVSQGMEKQLMLPDLYNEMDFHGLLIIGIFQLNYVQKLLELEIPIVTVDHEYESLQLDTVVTVNAEDAFRIVTHLTKKGHRNIGFIGAIERSKNTKERWSGYQHAMFTAGLNVDMKNCLVDAPQLDALNANPAEFSICLDTLASMPTAWFCANDRIAIAFIQTLTSKGFKVPEDVSVVGFDDIEAAGMLSPRLTTIQVQREQLGTQAVDFLLRKIDYGGSPLKISIYGKLMERQSCAAPNEKIGSTAN